MSIYSEDSLIDDPNRPSKDPSETQKIKEAQEQYVTEVLLRLGAVESVDTRNTLHQIGLFSGCEKEIKSKPYSPLLSTGKHPRTKQYGLALKKYASRNPCLTFHSLVITVGRPITRAKFEERLKTLKKACNRLPESLNLRDKSLEPLLYAIHVQAKKPRETRVFYHLHAHFIIASPDNYFPFYQKQIVDRIKKMKLGAVVAKRIDKDGFAPFVSYLRNTASGLLGLPDEEIKFLHETLHRKHMFQAVGELKKTLAENKKNGRRFHQRINGKIETLPIYKSHKIEQTKQNNKTQNFYPPNSVMHVNPPQFTEARISEPLILVRNREGGLQEILNKNRNLRAWRNEIINEKRDQISDRTREIISKYS